jgi:hypothetical protein
MTPLSSSRHCAKPAFNCATPGFPSQHPSQHLHSPVSPIFPSLHCAIAPLHLHCATHQPELFQAKEPISLYFFFYSCFRSFDGPHFRSSQASTAL